jgi:hypothetical protein
MTRVAAKLLVGSPCARLELGAVGGRLGSSVRGLSALRTVQDLYDVEGVLGPTVTKFVARHVRSLLAWDIIVFFHRNPTAVLDASGLASRLGRRVEEVEPEVDDLCDGDILNCAGGLIRYDPTPELRDEVQQFVDACQDRGRRLALIAQVLHGLSGSS